MLVLPAAARHEPLQPLDLFVRFPVSFEYYFAWPKASLHALVKADAAKCVRVASSTPSW
ncbi:MAG: hypothetical protein ABIQ18_37000 [Umezawaea sp.]